MHSNIWLGDLIDRKKNVKVYSFKRLKITVSGNVISSVEKINYVGLQQHKNVLVKKEKTTDNLNNDINFQYLSNNSIM